MRIKENKTTTTTKKTKSIKLENKSYEDLDKD